MNAVFGENLTGVFLPMNPALASRMTLAAHSNAGSGHCAVPPDNGDRHLGRERPPAGRAWGEEGGSQVGVTHAPLGALLGCDSGADCKTGGTERRRRDSRDR